MRVRYTSAFKRAYRRLSPDQRARVDHALELFFREPFHPQLRNHKLTGSQKGVRSLAAGYDLRILYADQEAGGQEVVLLAVGTHDGVYS